MTTVTCRQYEIVNRKNPYVLADWVGHEKKDFIVEVDGDNIVVNGYSMPVKKERDPVYAFTFVMRKTFIKATGTAKELYNHIEKEKDGIFWCDTWHLVNWVTNFGKKEERA